MSPVDTARDCGTPIGAVGGENASSTDGMRPPGGLTGKPMPRDAVRGKSNGGLGSGWNPRAGGLGEMLGPLALALGGENAGD